MSLQESSHRSTTPIDFRDRAGNNTSRLINELQGRGLWTLVCAISKAHYAPPAAVVGRGRTKRLCEARHAVWASIYAMGIYSYPDIGLIFDRDHTTILAGVRQHQRRTGAQLTKRGAV